jgi:protease IV
MPTLSLPGPDRTPILLELDLTHPLIEVEPDDPIGKLRSRGKPRLRPILRALHEAGGDPHVAGLVAKIGGAPLPLPVLQELRAGVRAFAASGKPTVAWAETFGESTPASGSYLLATGFGQIWLQPSGELNLLGVAAEVQFLRGALDTIGVEPEFGQRHEYKSAADRIVRKEFTDAHREAVDRLTESAWEQITEAVSEARGMPADAVVAAADRAPLLAQEALDAGLVDRLGYRDEVYASLRRDAGGTVRLLFADRWRPHQGPVARIRKTVAQRNAPGIALVEGHGGIVTGRSRRAPLQGRVMGSDTIAAAFRAAVRDDKVRAIVFRVDSPGGSAVASDTIWREVGCAREAGKPVIVSMGTLAGSGGYYVACPADVIVAQPATLTGSIGVLGGKFVTTGLTDRIGLTYGAVQRGRNARMFSPRVPFGEAGRERLEAMLDAVYADFTRKVAEGRGLSREAVEKVARGRVWTGADAARIGLVDELGGLRRATEIARARADLPADAPVRPAVVVPPLARLRGPTSSDDPRAAAAASIWAAGWGDFAALAAALGFSAYGPLTMPSVVLT